MKIYNPALVISIEMNNAQNYINNFPTNHNNSYNFRKCDFSKLYDTLLNIDWSFLSSFNDVNSICTQFFDKLDFVFESCVPKKSASRSRKYPPWFNGSIIKKINLKERLRKQYTRTGDLSILDDFKSIRQEIKNDVNIAYKNFVQSSEKTIKSDPNKFWAFINSKKGSTNVSEEMYFDGVPLNNPHDIVNAFANYFSQSYTDPSLDNENNSTENGCPNNNPIVNINAFHEVEVIQALKRVKPKMTTGPDSIPAFLLKDCAIIFGYPLTLIFNLILKTCQFPDLWKYSKVCPIYKKGNKLDIQNFRPISVICNFCKVLETLLHDRIYHSINTKISIHQHGFMKGRSTTTNLFCVTQYISESLDKHSQTDVIYTDFTKAFDRLDHQLLLNKLEKIGLSYSLLLLFKSYLTNRVQYVALRGFKSIEFGATSGVPQGSILGPLLFNIFINDIIDEIDLPCLLYADDLKIFTIIDNIDDCFQLQACLNKINNWCIVNKLLLNANKCNVLSFSLKSSPIIFDYNLDNVIIQRPLTFRDLGVTFDNKLSFINHIDTIVSEAFKNLGFIVRTSREFTNTDTLKILYQSFVRSKLEYASLIWCPSYDIHIKNLEAVQRRFVKLLWFRSDGTYPTIGFPQNDLLKRYSMSTLEDRRIYFSQVFLFKSLNNDFDVPDIISKLNFHVPRLTSRTTQVFYLPTPHTNILKDSPLFTICNNFNNLCSDLDIFNCSLNDIKSKVLN